MVVLSRSTCHVHAQGVMSLCTLWTPYVMCLVGDGIARLSGSSKSGFIFSHPPSAFSGLRGSHEKSRPEDQLTGPPVRGTKGRPRIQPEMEPKLICWQETHRCGPLHWHRCTLCVFPGADICLRSTLPIQQHAATNSTPSTGKFALRG